MSADELMLVLVFGLCCAGALLGTIISEKHNPLLLACVGSLASLLTLWVSGRVLWSGQIFQSELWTIRGLGPLMVSLDRISALFLIVAGVVVLASSIFSASYLKRYSGHHSLKALTAWYLLLFASIVLILIANDVLTFLLAWELMSILSYLLVTFERDLNKLGGLIRLMPWTGACFLAGALSIAALPPFNGFVSEWLTLQTMLRSAELSSTVVKIVFALCGAALALTAALAATCFVKAFAMGFLGLTRSPQAQKSVEAPHSMTAPMVLLAVLCLLLGVLPTFLIPILNHVLQPMTGANAADALVPPFFASGPAHAQLPIAFAAEFHDLGAQVGQAIVPAQGLVVMHRGGPQNPVVFAMSTSYMLPALLALLALTHLIVRFGLASRRRMARRPCWDGGVPRLLSEMTYTATGFSNPVRVIFEAVLQPNAVMDTRETVSEHFRTAIRRRREEMHIVERYVAAPLRNGALNVAGRLASMHHGRINDYAGYGLLALIIALVLALSLSALT